MLTQFHVCLDFDEKHALHEYNPYPITKTTNNTIPRINKMRLPMVPEIHVSCTFGCVAWRPPIQAIPTPTLLSKSDVSQRKQNPP